MRKKRLIKTGLWLMAVVLFVGCTNEDAVQKTDQDSNQRPNIVANFMGIQKTPNTPAKSRTTATHTVGNPAKVEWEATDRILVKAVDGTWHQSEPAQFLSADHSRANFKLTSGTYGFNPEVQCWSSGWGNIENIQTQNMPNDFSHLGVSGDCGNATARGGGGDYEFTLEHRASYLCFLPRCTDAALGPNIKLQQIEVEADNYKRIAGQGYTFSNNGSLADPMYPRMSKNKITLKLNDFPLDNTTTDIDKNGAYMVLEPGTFDFTIRYTIHDATTNVTGVITKKLPNFNCPEGKIKDITANLVPQADKYYMWDAKYDYWYNHLKADGTPDGDNPKNNTDPRWFHEGSGVVATESCKDCPNVNEICWYVMKGDAHWVDNVESRLIVNMGHLQKVNVGGVWLRKKSAIVAYLKANEGYPANFTEADLKAGYKTSASAAPKDYTLRYIYLNAPVTLGTPAPIEDYFFLPALGWYSFGGALNLFGSIGNYWSASESDWYIPFSAFSLTFSNTGIAVGGRSERYLGYSVSSFE